MLSIAGMPSIADQLSAYHLAERMLGKGGARSAKEIADENRRKIMEAIEDLGQASLTDICHRIRMNRTTADGHIKRLTETGRITPVSTRPREWRIA
jgi:predicted transcriptional regulator